MINKFKVFAIIQNDQDYNQNGLFVNRNNLENLILTPNFLK